MKVSCPHCLQRLDLDSETLDSLREAPGFDCPACGGQVPLTLTSPEPGKSPSASGWTAPDVEELSRSFDSRYQIRRILGRGGMGAVYEGLDTRLDRRVAIKILPAETGRSMDVLARFEREAKAMAALDHPNIVHIHDYGSTGDGHPYLVMEFIDGMDLHGLRHSGNLDLPGALEIISQVCAALHYAHNRGIIHRDIKPANIMVTHDGVAKVADFGLAKVLGTDDQPRYDPTLTLSGMAMGTPDYMAPEQLEGQPVDHRADIYSLGVMLYALLTGSPPRGAWPPPSQRVQIDIRLDEIVLRALQQNPSARYQAASEVRADIDSVKFSTGGGPLPPGVDPAPLPSSMASSVPLHSAPASSTSVRASGRAAKPKLSPAGKPSASTDGLGTTMLILGLLAIAILGGLALYLANRKTGDTYSIEHSINDKEENNRIITRDIPPGLSVKDVEGVGDIRSHDGGFIGISMEALDWEQAQSLAERVGAEVLSVDESLPAWKPLHEWLQATFPTAMNSKAWARNASEPRILDSQKVIVPDSPLNLSPELRHKVLLHWQARTTSSSPAATPTTAADDWIDLLDGQDVSKWKGSKNAGFPEGAWGVEGGALRNFHGANHQDLETRETFRDFELEFEWKLSPGGNSGIFYGMREFQLVDDAGHANGKVPVTSCGALCYFIPPNSKKRINPAGEYNRGKLIVRGNQEEHWINGEKVLEYKLGSPELESLVESGQFKNLPGYRKIDTTAGETRIGLQSHGGNVWFRNIRIRKLDGLQATTGTAPKQRIDLLALIDPEKDRVMPGTMGKANDWEKSGGLLRYNSDGNYGKVVAPVAINAGSYEIEISYRRLGSIGRFHVDLPIAGQVLPIALDSVGRRPIHGQAGEPLPESLPVEGRYLIRYDVGKIDQLARITIQLDGTTLSDWKGQVTPYLKDLRGREDHPEFPRQSITSIFCGTDSYEFTEWTLRVFEGDVKVLREAGDTTSLLTPPAPASGPLPWTNTDGKTIQAEFVRLSADTVVIRKDGNEFSILTSKLTQASAAQARTLALQQGLPGGKASSSPGRGKRVVLLAGDTEYRSEEALPQLAKILNQRHGFECTVLHSINKQTGEIDQKTNDNQPGMEALASADLVITSLFFRKWPDAQMDHFAAYIASGKPVIALRTSTHAFKGLSGTHAGFNRFGEDMLGTGWISHWGNHKREGGGATRGVIEPTAVNDVLLRGVTDIFAATNVYEVALPADVKILVRGVALNGGNPGDAPAIYIKKRVDGKEQAVNAPPMPIVWTRTANRPLGNGNRILCITAGSASDLQNEGLRRLIVNGVYSFTGLTVPAKADVNTVGDYKPSSDGGKLFIGGKKPEDYFPGQ